MTTLQTEEQLTRAVYRVSIEQSGAALDETRKLCDISLTPVLSQSISIDRAVLENIKFLDVDRGVISSLEPGGSYTSSTEVAFWGIDPSKMDRPLSDPLPTSVEHKALYDADDDGNPAVTYDLQGGACLRYNAQRQLIRYRGTFTTPNQIDGTSTGHTDVVVYGASKGLCELEPKIRANDPKSRFRMYRIDGQGGAFNADDNGDGTITCEEIRAIPTAQIYEARKPSDENCETDT